MTIIMSVIGDVPEWIFQDEARFLQVLNNLLSNAIKFTAEGEVIISVEMDRHGPGDDQALWPNMLR